MPVCLSVPPCVTAFKACKLLFSREEANKREEEELQFKTEELSCHIEPEMVPSQVSPPELENTQRKDKRTALPFET